MCVKCVWLKLGSVPGFFRIWITKIYFRRKCQTDRWKTDRHINRLTEKTHMYNLYMLDLYADWQKWHKRLCFFDENFQYILFPKSPPFSTASLHSALLLEQVLAGRYGGWIRTSLGRRGERAEVLRLHIWAGAVTTQEIHTLIRM